MMLSKKNSKVVVDLSFRKNSGVSAALFYSDNKLWPHRWTMIGPIVESIEIGVVNILKEATHDELR